MAALSRMVGRPLRYELLDVSPEGLAGALDLLRADAEVVGANVTLPHKTAALELADDASDLAVSVGAANLLTRDGERLRAHNTDSQGFAEALRLVGFSPRGRTALLLGAGGAARAVAHAWLREGGEKLLVANRTLSRARSLSRSAQGRVEVISFQETAPRSVDLVIHATSLGVHPGDGPVIEKAFAPLLRATIEARADLPTVDLVYTRDGSPTPFLALARELGFPALADGIPMLVCQAVAAFNVWMRTEIDPADCGALLSGP